MPPDPALPGIGGAKWIAHFRNFAAAIAFVNRVAEVAEAADHHPDILVHAWNRVRLRVTTHSAGALTEKDFELASAIDRLDE